MKKTSPEWTGPRCWLCVGAFARWITGAGGGCSAVKLWVLVGCLGGLVLAYEEDVWLETIVNKATRPYN